MAPGGSGEREAERCSVAVRRACARRAFGLGWLTPAGTTHIMMQTQAPPVPSHPGKRSCA